MKEDKSAKNIFQREEDFLAWLTREANSEGHRDAIRSVEQGPHPADELLYDYVWGELDRQTGEHIKAHIAFCGICAEEVLRLRLVAEELEEKLLDWANTETISVTPSISSQKGLSSKKDLLGVVATELWEPQWTGQLATAADIPAQEHVFRKEDGEIKISCFWRGRYRKRPAYISISWTANVTTRNELRVRFVNPETREQLSEVDLGTRLAGEEVLTSDDLGFDPSLERWAIALIINEVEI